MDYKTLKVKKVISKSRKSRVLPADELTHESRHNVGMSNSQLAVKLRRYRTFQVRSFIKNFDFSNPAWDNLPIGFFSFDTSSLSNKEQGLYSGIVFAWIVNMSEEIKKQYFNLRLLQNPFIYNSFQVGKIFLFILIFILITGNILNYIFIEVSHTIL